MNIGDKYTLTHIVSETETAENIGSGGLPVYSTPSMIGLMEKTAFAFAAENGMQTVGTMVNINHLRAVKVGAELKSEAELIEIDGRRMRFNVVVSDCNGIIGEGSHERFSIDPERFMAKLG